MSTSTQIIYYFSEIKEKKRDSKLYKRNMKYAKFLTLYPLSEVVDMMLWLKRNVNYNWGLETVYKKLYDKAYEETGGYDKNRKKLKEIKKKIGYDMVTPEQRSKIQEELYDRPLSVQNY